MSISESDVRRVAALARVGLRDEDIPALVAQLNDILVHMDVLQTVSIPPNPAEHDLRAAMPLRADDVGAVALNQPRESFAPLMRDGFFLVPRLATHDGTSSA